MIPAPSKPPPGVWVGGKGGEGGGVFPTPPLSFLCWPPFSLQPSTRGPFDAGLGPEALLQKVLLVQLGRDQRTDPHLVTQRRLSQGVAPALLQAFKACSRSLLTEAGSPLPSSSSQQGQSTKLRQGEAANLQTAPGRPACLFSSCGA